MTFGYNIRGILELLGARDNKRYILSSLSLVIIAFFYCFVLGSVLHPRIYQFFNRVTYETVFASHVIDLKNGYVHSSFSILSVVLLSIKSRYYRIPIMIFFSVIQFTFLKF